MVRDAIAGNRDAVRTLVELLTPVIQTKAARALLRRRIKDGARDINQEVEDLIQTVFVSLFAHGGRTLKQWDPTKGLSLVGFVAFAAEREIASNLRSYRRNPWTDLPTDWEDLDRTEDLEVGPERRTGGRETLEVLLEMLKDRLSDQGFEIFYWLFVEGRDIEEVCEPARLTPDAVYAWQSRLQKQVRQLAEKCCQF